MTEIEKIKVAAECAFPNTYEGYNDGYETITGCDHHYKEREIFEKTALYLQNDFKKIFYAVELRHHGIVAYFQKKKNAQKYIDDILYKLKKEKVDTAMLLAGFHYTIIELTFND